MTENAEADLSPPVERAPHPPSIEIVRKLCDLNDKLVGFVAERAGFRTFWDNEISEIASLVLKAATELDRADLSLLGMQTLQFLPTEDGEFNGNESQSAEINVDKVAKAIVLAVCELDDIPDPEDEGTILITARDLEAVAHRHITAALERAALSTKEPTHG